MWQKVLTTVGLPLLARAVEDFYDYVTSDTPEVTDKKLSESDLIYIKRKAKDWEEGKLRTVKTQQHFTDMVNKALGTSKSKAVIMRIVRSP